MAFTKFTAENAAMLLIDHQVGTMSWAKSTPFEQLKRNTLMLAKSAAILNMPVILTSSMEEHAQGPLLEEMKVILPTAYETRIKRLGIVNAMDDDDFSAAVRGLGKSKLIIAGVTNDVCTVYPALTLAAEGFDIQVVADAGASPTKMADDIALRRMDKNGITLTTTNQLIAELAGSWATPQGEKLIQVLMESFQ